MFERLLNDDPRVHGRPVDGALEEFGDFDQAMLGVQVDDAEHLVAPPGEFEAQKTLDVRGRREGAAGTVAGREHGEGKPDDGRLLGSRQASGRERMKAVLILKGSAGGVGCGHD